LDGLRAPTPFRIRCARCRTKLRVRMPGLAVIFTAICFVALMLGVRLVTLITTKRLSDAFVLGLGILVGALVMDLLLGTLLFTGAHFTPIDQKLPASRPTPPTD
jgi:hypothetical protein